MQRLICVYMLLICCGLQAQRHTLDTLSHIDAYLQTVPEAPAADGDDWYNPSFSSFFYQQQPSLLDQFAQWCGLWQSGWDAKEFYDALTDVTQQRKDITFTKDNHKEPSQMLEVPEHAQCVIWGDLHGALHSFYRGLVELHNQGKINDGLQLQEDNLYLVVIGDAVNRSPYSLEILTIILHLMQQNPDRVIYIRGNHESTSYWINFSMREQLKLQASHLSDQEVPLKDEINVFFETLPRVVYMSIADKPAEIIHVSHLGRGSIGFDFDETDVEYIQRIVSSIRGESRFNTLQKQSGLEMLGFKYGSTEWSLLSCPVWTYQTFFNFKDDAFSFVQFGSSMDDTTVSLYKRPVDNTSRAFSVAQTYSLVSAQKLAEQEKRGSYHDLSALWIGSSMALSQGLGAQGLSVERGFTVGVNQANNAGGVAGQLIRPFIFDDAYTPYRAVQNVSHLLQDFDTRVFVAPTGTPTVQAYDSLVRNNDGAILFPITGAPQFRTAEKANMVHFRPSYVDEARTLTQHMIDEYKITQMAFLYQDDDFGRPLRDAAVELLKERGITEWHEIPYVAGQIDFAYQARQLQEYNVGAIGLFATTEASKGLIRNLPTSFLIGTQLFGNSDLGEYSFKRFIQENGLQCLIALAVPDPKNSSIKIAQEFREQMDIIGWPYDVFSFEGYIAVQLLVDALRNVQKPISIQKMLNWLESLNQYQFKGLTLTFNSDKRDLSQSVALTTIE